MHHPTFDQAIKNAPAYCYHIISVTVSIVITATMQGLIWIGFLLVTGVHLPILTHQGGFTPGPRPVLETWGPKYPFINHIFGLKIKPKLQHWFRKLGGAFPRVRTFKVWQESDATLIPLHFFFALDLTPSMQEIELLNLEVSLVSDPRMKPPTMCPQSKEGSLVTQVTLALGKHAYVKAVSTTYFDHTLFIGFVDSLSAYLRMDTQKTRVKEDWTQCSKSIDYSTLYDQNNWETYVTFFQSNVHRLK